MDQDPALGILDVELYKICSLIKQFHMVKWLVTWIMEPQASVGWKPTLQDQRLHPALVSTAPQHKHAS